MTTTQSMSATNLTIKVDGEIMDMGNSPAALLDDIEIDLEDEDGHFLEDNSMIDELADNDTSMQADNSVTNQDDFMYDQVHDETDVDYQLDFDMDPSQQDPLHHHHVENTKSMHPHESLDQTDASQEPTFHFSKTASVRSDTLPQPQEEVEEPLLFDEVEEEVDLTNIPPEDDQPAIEHITNEPTQTENHHNPNTLHSATELADSITSSPFPDQQPDQETTTEADPNLPSNKQDYHVSAPKHEESDTEHGEEPVDSIDNLGLSADGADVQFVSKDLDTPHVHPIIVEYNNAEYWLLPTKDDAISKCLLEDTTLVQSPINDLLKELQNSVNDYLGHHDEIVLDIPTLGLHICEDSKYASELTLSQVIDTYMMLSQNQQLGHIPPLYCHLSHRTCLRTQMNYLVTSAREGKTYDAISAEHVESSVDVAEEFYEEQHDNPDLTEYYDAADHEEIQATTLDHTADAFEDQSTYNDDDHLQPPDESGSTAELDLPVEAVGDSDEVDLGEELNDGVVFTDRAQIQDQDDAAESVSSSIAEGGITSIPFYETGNSLDADNVNHQNADQVDDRGLIEEEDLFADDVPTNVATEDHTDGDSILPEAKSQSPSINRATEDDEINFDDWDKEDDAQPVAAVVPVTPSKAQNGKRKLVGDDDFELDLSTPEPKKNRSS